MNAFTPETCLIGCILLDVGASEIFSEVDVTEFKVEIYQNIYKKLIHNWRKDIPYTLDTVVGWPKEYKTAACECAEMLPSQNWKHFIEQLREKNIKEKAAAIGLYLASGSVEVDDIAKKVGELHDALNNNKSTEILNMKDGIMQFMRDKQKPIKYIKTGYSTIDKYTYMDKGDYVIIGGRPSAGKTAFSIQLALNMAKNGYSIVYFSLETKPIKMMDRIMTTFCGLDFSNVKNHNLGDDWEKTAALSDDLASYNINLVKASGKSVAWMKAEAKRLNADVVIIDYLQIVSDPSNSRFEKVTNISIDIHDFVQQTNVLGIVLAQINRGGSDEPKLEDLKESGQIEQDADIVFLLHKKDPVEEYDVPEYWVKIAKNKEGEVGKIQMYFDGQHQSFMELTDRR